MPIHSIKHIATYSNIPRCGECVLRRSTHLRVNAFDARVKTSRVSNVTLNSHREETSLAQHLSFLIRSKIPVMTSWPFTSSSRQSPWQRMPCVRMGNRKSLRIEHSQLCSPRYTRTSQRWKFMLTVRYEGVVMQVSAVVHMWKCLSGKS